MLVKVYHINHEIDKGRNIDLEGKVLGFGFPVYKFTYLDNFSILSGVSTVQKITHHILSMPPTRVAGVLSTWLHLFWLYTSYGQLRQADHRLYGCLPVRRCCTQG